jgi:hypothetical protein
LPSAITKHHVWTDSTPLHSSPRHCHGKSSSLLALAAGHHQTSRGDELLATQQPAVALISSPLLDKDQSLSRTRNPHAVALSRFIFIDTQIKAKGVPVFVFLNLPPLFHSFSRS